MNVQTAVFSLPVRRGRGGPGERSWRAVAACFWGPPLGTHAQTACPEGPLDPGCSAGQSHTSLSPADSVTEAQRGDRAGCHGAARGQAPAPRPCPVGATGGVGDGAGPQEASRALASCLHRPPGLLSQRASAAWSHRRLRKRQRSARQTPQGHWKRVPRGHVQRQGAGTRRRGGLLRQPRRVGPCPSPASHGLATGRCSPRLGPPVTVHGPGRRAWGPAAQRETHTLQDGGPARGASGAHGLGPSGGAVGSRPPREQGHQNPPAPQPTSFIGRRQALGGLQGASSGSLVGARALPPLRPAASQPPEICGRTGDSVSRRKPLLQNRGSGGPTEDTSPPSLFKACPSEGTAGQGGVGVPGQPTRHRQPGDVQRLGHVPGHQLPTRWLDRWGGGSRGPC